MFYHACYCQERGGGGVRHLSPPVRRVPTRGEAVDHVQQELLCGEFRPGLEAFIISLQFRDGKAVQIRIQDLAFLDPDP